MQSVVQSEFQSLSNFVKLSCYSFSATNLSEKNLALVVLYTQKCNNTKAEDYLRNITKENLMELLKENWDLLFETTFVSQNVPQRSPRGTMSFSDLSVLLISVCPDVLPEILVTLMMDKKVITLNKMIKVRYLLYKKNLVTNFVN